MLQYDYPDNSVHDPWWYLLVLRDVVDECFHGERGAMQNRLEWAGAWCINATSRYVLSTQTQKLYYILCICIWSLKERWPLVWYITWIINSVFTQKFLSTVSRLYVYKSGIHLWITASYSYKGKGYACFYLKLIIVQYINFTKN